MAISSKDIKKLWGLAAGRCSYLGCSEPCIEFIAENPTVLGEMAHMIAKRPRGPRGIGTGGADSYDNLILLCPTHHKTVDQSPDNFPAILLQDWKKRHEINIAEALASPVFKTLNEVAKYIRKLLIENRTVWKTYGPESPEAIANPLSNLVQVWVFRKFDTIIPNNCRIVKAIQRNKDFFDAESYETACVFIEHAEGFERNYYNRIEDIPSFPKQFDEMVTYHAKI